MKNKEIMELSQGLPLCGSLKGIKIAFAIAKNSRIISREMEGVAEALKKLQEEHAQKDKDGNPIIEDNKYQMIDEKQFNEEYQKLMDIETEVNLHKIKQEDLPEDISARQLAIIMDFIEE